MKIFDDDVADDDVARALSAAINQHEFDTQRQTCTYTGKMPTTTRETVLARGTALIKLSNSVI